MRRPRFGRSNTDYESSSSGRTTTTEHSAAPSTLASVSSSGLQTPSEKRHISFNDEVVQCIAVEAKSNEDEDYETYNPLEDSDTSDDEGVVMMKAVPSRLKISNRPTPRTSLSSERTIAPLPSTTLKYRGDTPEPPDYDSTQSSMSWLANRLSTSSSQETLRPSQPSSNFLIPDDDDESMNWQPSMPPIQAANSNQSRSPLSRGRSHSESDAGPGMRRTPSGMFMPISEDEDDVINEGLFGKVVDTVNTARDIAHVIWNVGWRR